MDSTWDSWIDKGLEKLFARQLNLKLSTVFLSKEPIEDDYEVLDESYPFNRSSVEVFASERSIKYWLLPIDSTGEEDMYTKGTLDNKEAKEKLKKLLIFSGNDYLGLGSHPSIAKAAAKAAQNYGMGPRGSGVVCGYTSHHRLLESSLADLKKKEDCLLCPTGFSANMALMVTLGTLVLLTSNRKSLHEEKVAIFSDELNHGSIIDGIRLAERQGTAESFIYKHCDMSHLSSLLASCKLKKKVVVTDSLFSMDGHFAPMLELVNLRKKHGFLLVIDDAHATFVCGKNGGGAAEMFNCEKDIDICVGTLSKAAGCQGGFIACSKKWKLLILSLGRSFVFTTTASIPVVAASHAAVVLGKKEEWRRKAVWNRVRDFQALTGITLTSPIISLVLGNAENAFKASRHLMQCGFHVVPIIPPAVPPNSCRLRVILSSLHTIDDVKKLVAALSNCVNFEDVRSNSITTPGYSGFARL